MYHFMIAFHSSFVQNYKILFFLLQVKVTILPNFYEWLLTENKKKLCKVAHTPAQI